MVAKIQKGNPELPGAKWDAVRGGVNFSLFSANAGKVELCLFDENGVETRGLFLERGDGNNSDIWTGFLPGLKPGQQYGYRVHGPYDPANGHRFNAAKLLLDPEARELAWPKEGFNPRLQAHHAYNFHTDPNDPKNINAEDNAPHMIKARVIDPAKHVPVQNDTKPGHSLGQTIVYEAHVKGFSKLNTSLPEEIRGTFDGMADDSSIEYLKKLGVTAIELIPVHPHIDEGPLLDKGKVNYWGYNSLNFFTTDPRFGDVEAFKNLVKKLHAAGIEVVLDVVYNHTPEGNERGPTLSYRGIDNASYYILMPDGKQFYRNASGCGNTVNLNYKNDKNGRNRVAEHIIRSLKFWRDECGIDGVRFDLGRVNGVMPDGSFTKDSPFIKAVTELGLKLTLEPWDLEGYVLHEFNKNYPPGWNPWSDVARDGLRKFWIQQADVTAWGQILAGSSHIFDHEKKGPAKWRSVNVLTKHDGLVRKDLVEYSGKHNEANGENNTDGHDKNFSNNHGVEGETTDPAIKAVRLRQCFNMAASMYMAYGIPLLLSGDELGRTQNGNNNAYCQDNEISWNSWDLLKTQEGAARFAAESKLIKIRKSVAPLIGGEYSHGFRKDEHGEKDITWWNPSGKEQPPQWQANTHCIGLIWNNGAVKDHTDNNPYETIKANSRVLVIPNASTGNVPFVLPTLKGGGDWSVIFDTSSPNPGAEPATPVVYKQGQKIDVPYKSTMILVQTPPRQKVSAPQANASTAAPAPIPG